MPALTHNRVKNGFNGGIRKRNATRGTVNRRISGMGKVDGLRSKALVRGIGSTPEHIRRAYNRRVRCSCKTQSPSEVEITGTFTPGETLGVTLINFNDVGKSPNIAYQWTRNNVDITGETNDSYTILSSDFNKTISVRVTYINIYKVTRIIKANNPTLIASPAGTQTGSVTITATGGYKVGQILTANTSTITDTNVSSAISFTYQWTRNGTNISGATSQNYLQVSADAGNVINVKAIYTNDYSIQVTVTSTNTTQTIQNTIASVAITGIFKEGQTLQAVIADNDTFDESKVTFTWKNNDPTPATLHTGTGSTYKNYTIASGNAGKIINVTVVYVDNNGFSENVTSTNTNVVDTLGSVSLSGTYEVNKAISANITDADGVQSISSYQWIRSDASDMSSPTNIGTNSTYTPVIADIGKYVSVKITYTDNQNFVTTDIQPTNGVQVIAESNLGSNLAITGTLQQGSVLTATVTDNNNINTTQSVSFKWQRVNGTSVSDITTNTVNGNSGTTVTNTYTLVGSDVGNQIRVIADYTDAGGNVESLTETTATNITAVDTVAPTLTAKTQITTPTNDNTPSFVFTSDEAGTITSSHAFTPTSAISGDNTITFNTLPDGTYSNVWVKVEDAAGNISSELTLDTFVVDTVECLTLNSTVNVVSSGGNKYVFNGATTYDSTKKYGLNNATYTFKDISMDHPLAILNNGKTNISYSAVGNTGSPIIIKVNGGATSESNGDFYVFKDENDNIINIGNGTFRFMRGKTYKFEADGISTDHPFKIYMSGGFVNDNNGFNTGITGSTNSITITIPASHITTAGGLYYQCSQHSGMNKNLSLFYKDGPATGVSYDFYYGDISVTVSGDFGEASVYCYYHGYMGGENLLKYKSSCSP